ncbi:MAG: SAF domain-containing protein [Bacillota bacterium]
MVYIKRSKSTILFKAAITVLIIISAFVFAFMIMRLTSTETVVQSHVNQSAGSNAERKGSINAVRAKELIKAGEITDASRFEYISLPSELIPYGAVTSMEALKGKRLKNDVVQNEIVLATDLLSSDAWYEDGDRLIEHMFQPGTVPATVTEGSIVDVKLFLPKEADSIVVSKAVVVKKQENTLSFYLNLLEQEYLKEAAAEGVLFLTQYLDSSQPPSEISYTDRYNAMNPVSSEQ